MALLTMEDSDLNSLTFVASARLAKQQAKQHQPKMDTVKAKPQDMQPKPKLKKGYYEVEKILDHRGTKSKECLGSRLPGSWLYWETRAKFREVGFIGKHGQNS